MHGREVARYLGHVIAEDALSKRGMVFVTGPRQVGKTTAARRLLQHSQNYFLYDDESFRRAWARSPMDAIGGRDVGAVVLDEIHKDRRWKSKLKGIYDQIGKDLPIVVTGSARFDFFRKGADSLMGRYLPYRMHPFSVAESQRPPRPDDIFAHAHVAHSWEALLALGGFPEPFLRGEAREALRWSALRRDRLVLEDSRDFRNISDVNALRVLTDLLPERVGSLLSINSLREDVGKAYATVRDWMMVLDVLYDIFVIRPFTQKISRSLRAEPKLYLFDINRIPNTLMPKRIENLAALHLLKACHFWTDTAQGQFDLRFIRNKDGREVDFVLVRDNQAWMLIECKSNATHPNPNLIHYTRLLKPRYAVQLVTDRYFDRVFSESGIRVMNYEKFFACLV